jgi:hypothetical protein
VDVKLKTDWSLGRFFMMSSVAARACTDPLASPEGSKNSSKRSGASFSGGRADPSTSHSFRHSPHPKNASQGLAFFDLRSGEMGFVAHD